MDRLVGSEDVNKISLHQFVSMLREYVRGKVTFVDVITAFELDGDEVTQAKNLQTAIDGLTTLVEKLDYVQEVEDAAILSEMPSLGVYNTKSKLQFRMGI